MSPASFRVAAFCAANLFLTSGALAQDTNFGARTSASALPKDIIGGSIYSPDGITLIVGDGMGGGFIFGPDGSTTFISDGVGGARLYPPNSTGAMIGVIGDGTGGALYSPKRIQPSQEQGTPGRDMRTLLLILLVAAIGIGWITFYTVRHTRA
jgi:hypothetical protein